MAIQAFIRRGTRSNATARRLIASSQNIAPHVLRSTIERDDIHQPVMRCLALEDCVLMSAPIAQGWHFYLVASKFVGRYYVLSQMDGKWMCSSSDPRVKDSCIKQVRRYLVVLCSRQAA